jgi:hypothetical protein
MSPADTILINVSRILTRTLQPEDQLFIIYRFTEAGVNVSAHGLFEFGMERATGEADDAYSGIRFLEGPEQTVVHR